MSLCATIFVVLSEHDRKKKTLGRSEIPTLRVYFTLCYLMLTCLKGSISWTAHVRAEAQNLKNSAEYCKIDPAKKRQRLHAAKAAMAKKTISDLKQCKREWFQTFNVLSSKIIYFSRGFQRNSRQDVNVLVAAISRHVRYLLNIGEVFLFFPWWINW